MQVPSFQTIFLSAPDAVIVIDEIGNIIHWNSKAEIMFGWSGEEVTGKSLAETIIPEKYKLRHQQGMKHYMETGIGPVLNKPIEIEGRRRDGSEFDISLSISPSRLDEKQVFIGFIRDITEEKKAAENLRYNSLLLQNVSDAVISTDANMVIRTWNPAAEKMYGYTLEEVVGRSIDILQLELSADIRRKQQDVLKQHGYYKDEYTSVDKYGKEIIILASINVIKSSDKVKGYVAVHRDITLRKKLEAQLRLFNKDLSRLVEEKTAEIKNIFERVSDAFLAVDKDWRYTYANKQLGEMIQMAPATLIGKNMWEVFPEAVGSETYKSFHLAMSEQRYICSTDYYAPLNLWQENHIYPSPNGLSVFIRDVSERKRNEIALRQSEEKYRSLIEQAADAIALFDDQNRILDVNASATQLLGYSGDELRNMSLNHVLSPHELKTNPVRFDILEKGESTIKPRRMIRKNGSVIETEVHAKKLSDGTFLALIRDLTERRKAEEELQQSYDAIRDLVSHLQDIREEERLRIAQEIHDELGQQLTVMKMDVSWLDKKLAAGDPQIRERTEGLKNMLDTTVKTVRRIASELRPSILDDMGLAVALDWHIGEMQKRTGINIDFEASKDEMNLPDEIKISVFRIVQEALTNVARYSKAQTVKIKLDRQPDSLNILIRDDGIGFDQSKIAVKKTLGILGMKERAAKLGGEFRIVSSPGNGTTINVEIPVKQQPTPPSPLPS